MDNNNHSLDLLNLIVAAFGAMMMFRMKSETSRESPWTRRIGIALLIFALQYAVYSIDPIKETTKPLFGGGNDRVWSESFALPIDFFILTAARMLLNRQQWLPRWFFVLVTVDLVAVVLGVLTHIDIDGSPGLFATSCRLAGDGITFASLLCLGYASYINTKLDKTRSGIVGGAVIGIIYGGIHLISSLTPNISHWSSSTAEGADRLSNLLLFVAAMSKLVIVYTAFDISALEYQTLIRLRRKLRESVDARKAFFSSSGILGSIIEAFEAEAVKLYVRVPPVTGALEDRTVHVYSAPWDGGDEYQIRFETDTPIPGLSDRLTEERHKKTRSSELTSPGSLWGSILRAARSRGPRTMFGGVEPIRYHGALIGALKIEREGEFTYSAETLCRILSEDISALVQFYRVQESFPILIEGFHRIQETLLQKEPPVLSTAELNRSFEEIIQQVLSPSKTRFLVNAGFLNTDLPAPARADEARNSSIEQETVFYACITDHTKGSRTIAHISLDYQKHRDPVANPSLGDFKPYGEAVASIVTRSFLSCVEQRFNLIIRNLSLELTKKLGYDKLLDQIQASVREAELAGVVIYHSGLRDFSNFVRKSDGADNLAVAETLAAAFPDAKRVLEELDYSPTLLARTYDRLIVGMKLRFAPDVADLGDAGLFVGIRRLDFADELSLNTPWFSFLKDLANIAGNALERVVQAKKLQRKQIQQTEDRWILSTAEKVGLITHKLLNRIENLANSSALLKLDLPEWLDEGSRKPIDRRIEEIKKEFSALRSLTGEIRSNAQVQERSGPSSLMKSLKGLARLHESGSNVKIEIQGLTNRSVGPDSGPLSDVKVNLPKDIMELILSELIRNSVAAIRRRANNETNGAGGNNCQGAIKIWAEVDDGSTLINCFINDNGSGISPAMVDRIFDVDVTSTPGHGGWGLFYVKRKLEGNAGSINLEHSEPGNTTFRVCLPRYR